MTSDLETLLHESTWIRRLAGRLVKSADDADDLSQEVLARALLHRPVEQGPRLRAWLATVTRNLASQGGLRELRRSGVEAAAAPTPKRSKTTAWRGWPSIRLLVEAIGTLPAQQREVVLLRFFDDLAPRQIAHRLGVPSETVRKRLSRALRRLREDLDRQADSADSSKGRALWCAAFTEHLVPSGIPVGALFSPLFRSRS